MVRIGLYCLLFSGNRCNIGRNIRASVALPGMGGSQPL